MKIQLSPTKERFYKNVAVEVVPILSTEKISPEMVNVILAQVVLETQWGKKIQGNNLFNIKGAYRGESVIFTTHEELPDGTMVKNLDTFRKYPDYRSSILDYIQLLKKKWPQSHRYLFAAEADTALFIGGLRAGEKGGYATDSRYAGKLQDLSDQIAMERSGDVLPTYLSCLGREDELERIKKNEKK